MSADGKRQAVTIPEGSVVKILTEGTGNPNSFVLATLGDQTVSMFAEDVRARGDEVPGHEKSYEQSL